MLLLLIELIECLRATAIVNVLINCVTLSAVFQFLACIFCYECKYTQSCRFSKPDIPGPLRTETLIFGRARGHGYEALIDQIFYSHQTATLHKQTAWQLSQQLWKYPIHVYSHLFKSTHLQHSFSISCLVHACLSR